MAYSLPTRAASLLTLAAMAVVPLAVSIVACGGGGGQPVTPPPSATASASPPPTGEAPTASASTSAPAPTDTTPPPPPPAPTSTVATTKTDATWATCHQSFKAKNKDVAKDVAAMAAGCAKATKMKKVGKTLTGKQADQDAPQTFPFEAKANHCYRAYGQASDTIQDLDVVVKDSAKIVVGQDSTDDSSPVVLEDGAVCFSKDDQATVVVAVGMGKGSYALEIWGD